MNKVDEYRRHAQECRALAAKMPTPEAYEQLLEMAAIWERMASERTEFVAKHPEFNVSRNED